MTVGRRLITSQKTSAILVFPLGRKKLSFKPLWLVLVNAPQPRRRKAFISAPSVMTSRVVGAACCPTVKDPWPWLKVFLVGGWVAAKDRGSILASQPEAPGSILGVSKNFSLDVADIY